MSAIDQCIGVKLVLVYSTMFCSPCLFLRTFRIARNSTTIDIEDGEVRPFNCVIETPRDSNAIAVYNTNPLEYPLDACVEADTSSAGIDSFTQGLAEKTRIVQGGAIYTQPFDPSVQSVQILITTDGRPLNSRVELLQGPNNQKQVMEIYTEDGLERPLFAVLDTPGMFLNAWYCIMVIVYMHCHSHSRSLPLFFLQQESEMLFESSIPLP